MSQHTTDLDGVLESAWRHFLTLLADALDNLEPRATLDIRRDDPGLNDGVAACVHARRQGDRIILESATNRILATSQRLSKAARRQIRELGFAKPEKAGQHYSLELPATHVDQAASVVVRVLRHGYGVVHPSFLITDDIEWIALTEHPKARTRVEAVVPDGRAHLDELVEEALRPMLGPGLRRDSDGDIPYAEGTAVVFVRTRSHSSLIRLFAHMVVDVQDQETALCEVDALNRDILGIKFTLDGDKVIASAELQGSPFVAEHLQILLAHLADTVSTRDADLAQRLGGRVFARPADPAAEENQPSDVHPIMFNLFRFDAANPGSFRASVAAEMCGYDSGVLNHLIRWNEDQQALWKASRDQAHTANEHEFAAVCEAQRAHAARTARILRKALRRVQPS